MSAPLTISIAILCVLLGLLYSFLQILSSFKPQQKFPPGPRALPIIGNLHMLGTLPHRGLRTLAQKYGPIMFVRLGHVPTVVISSPAAAELVLKVHDGVFASRPRTQASEYLAYGTKGIAFTEYGPYLRYVRKLCTLHLFSSLRIKSFEPLRRQLMNSMVERLRKAAERHEEVDLSEKVSELIEEISFRMMVGNDHDIDIVEFSELAKEAMTLIGTFNLADYVPYLGALDIQGLKRRMKKLSKAIDKILDNIMNEIIKQNQNEAQKASENTNNYKPISFGEVLISLINKPMNDHHDQPYILQLTDLKGVTVDLIAGAFHTSVTAIDWAMTELMRHPEVMECLQKELNDVVGTDRMVEEVDLPKLTYLDMVVKETLRLHPVAPLLIPRETMQDIEISGYYIAKKTRVLVNAWAISRDPTVWSDNAEKFCPERFISSDIDCKGHDFQFIPFGSGRRMCPGMQLGLTTIRLVVAQLVHCFTWKLPNGMLPDDLDMTEKFGLTTPRANHLLLFPSYRLDSE